MSGRNDCVGVLRLLVRLLIQCDDSCETELVCSGKQCEEKVFEGKNRRKTLSSNVDLSICLWEFSNMQIYNMQISKRQKLWSAQRCPVRCALKHRAYINIHI